MNACHQDEDRRRIAVRLAALQVARSSVFAALAICFWVLQIVQHDKYEEMAENNHQRTLALRAPRGVLFDRNGKVLVENRHSYTISIVREHTKDHRPHDPRCCRRWPASTRSRCSRSSSAIAREPTYRPIVVVEDASLAQVAAITARRLDFELPDVVVEEVPTRQYPDRRAGGAPVRLRRRRRARRRSATASRRARSSASPGVEKVYNKLLMGEDGAKRVVVNSMGREIRHARRECRRSKAAACS